MMQQKQAKFTHYVTSGFGMADGGWTAYHNKYKQTYVANRLYQSQLEVYQKHYFHL